MNIQLCGQVTGIPRGNAVFLFDAAERAVRAKWPDAYTYNPTAAIPASSTHEEAMHDCLRTLACFTNVLVTLPGWERSKGACLEVAVARAIGVEVVALEDIEGGAA